MRNTVQKIATELAIRFQPTEFRLNLTKMKNSAEFPLKLVDYVTISNHPFKDKI